MPKFLDRPSWYNSSGTQVYGVGTSSGNISLPCGYSWAWNDDSPELNYIYVGDSNGYASNSCFKIVLDNSNNYLYFYAGTAYIRLNVSSLSPYQSPTSGNGTSGSFSTTLT